MTVDSTLPTKVHVPPIQLHSSEGRVDPEQPVGTGTAGTGAGGIDEGGIGITAIGGVTSTGGEIGAIGGSIGGAIGGGDGGGGTEVVHLG